jgi:hypothetical protein
MYKFPRDKRVLQKSWALETFTTELSQWGSKRHAELTQRKKRKFHNDFHEKIDRYGSSAFFAVEVPKAKS